MPWNPALPADSSKIRLSANLIRQNFAAVQAGTVPAVKWNLVRQASTPTQPSNSGNIYTFAFNSKSELYYQNDSNQLVRMTQNGSNGSSEHDSITKDFIVIGQGIKFGTGPDYFYNADNFIVARGLVRETGSIAAQINMSSAKTGTGVYTVTIPAGILRKSSYQTMVTPYNQGTTIIANIKTAPSVSIGSPTNIVIETKARTDGSFTDTSFDIIIIGGR